MADYATLLRDHVTLTCRSVDRIFLQAYIPKLQSAGGVCQFLYWQKGFGIPPSAAFGKIGDAYVAAVHRWAKANAIPVRRFAKGESKEQIARPLIKAYVCQVRIACGDLHYDPLNPTAVQALLKLLVEDIPAGGVALARSSP